MAWAKWAEPAACTGLGPQHRLSCLESQVAARARGPGGRRRDATRPNAGILMREVGTSFLLTQLGYLVPTLLVLLIAFVLALVYMDCARTPSILTLSGVGVLVVAAIGVAVIQAWLVDSHQA